jgi:CcmD family protein
VNAGWLALALAAVIVGIGGYIAAISARRRKLERRLSELESSANNKS